MMLFSTTGMISYSMPARRSDMVSDFDSERRYTNLEDSMNVLTCSDIEAMVFGGVRQQDIPTLLVWHCHFEGLLV